MTNLEFRSLRAKRGKAAEKKILMEDYSILQAQSWNLVILACDNEQSTYNGLYPEGVGKARDAHMANVKLVEDKIRSICH
ncbi:hypothetical protein [Erwinia phage Virsaitis27]|nr:hypothetical protein [Erwinia phage Virsaitis27]